MDGTAAREAVRVPALDRHSLYEAAVQDAAALLAFLLELHGGDPLVLGEDCSGSGLLARRFADSRPDRRAVAVDLDPHALAHAAHERVERIVADMRTATELPSCDLVHLGNFSVGYLRGRDELLDYLRRTRRRLRPGGTLTLDTYGGTQAYVRGAVERKARLADGSVVEARLERVECDPLRARVVDHLHLRRVHYGVVLEDHPHAFVYDWRLWTPMELQEALLASGFDTTCTHLGLASPWCSPQSADIGDEWVVLIAAR